jgi:hypothetical protein
MRKYRTAAQIAEVLAEQDLKLLHKVLKQRKQEKKHKAVQEEYNNP